MEKNNQPYCYSNLVYFLHINASRPSLYTFPRYQLPPHLTLIDQLLVSSKLKIHSSEMQLYDVI